jgi:hypothetical protein
MSGGVMAQDNSVPGTQETASEDTMVLYYRHDGTPFKLRRQIINGLEVYSAPSEIVHDGPPWVNIENLKKPKSIYRPLWRAIRHYFKREEE